MKRFALVLLLLVMPFTAVAEDKNVLSVELMWELQRIGSPVISPNGEHIVAPVTRFDMDKERGHTQLYLFSPDGSTQRPLTAQGMRASEATFSPDGSTLAFISQRDGDDAGQIYLLPMDKPGEASRLTSVPTGVYGLKWKGDHLYFITRIWPGKDWDEMAERLKQEKASNVSAKKWTALPFSHFDHWLDENRQAHVFRIAAEGGDVEPVTQNFNRELPRSTQSSGSYDIDPSGTWIAFTSDSKSENPEPEIDLFLGRIGESTAENITEANPGPDGNPMFSPNGQTLAYTRQVIPGFYADNINIVLFDMERRTHREITADWDRSATGLVWTPDSQGFYGAIDDAATVRVYHINARNGQVRAITGETNFGGLTIANNGTLVGTNESFLHPAQLVRINPSDGSTARLDTFNDDILSSVDFGTYESVTYEGYNGQEIQMWVHYPPGFDPEKKYPLFLLIHGGPHNAISNGFHYRWNAQTFASWGYVTAWHNFHGSSGFGQEFTDSINPDWKTAPYADTIAAAEWFKNQPWIDNDRMVAGGASYGGYLSSILLGKEHPFNALLIHAAVYNMYSQMAADFAVHSVRFGNYWDNPEIYKEISPHYFAENFNTPALIIHGQLDYRVPVGQGFELFRTLQSRGVESRMIYFPDENHWILKPNNSVYWYNEVKDWVTRFAEPGAR
ncbi:S9 family peptidase [Aliidiomarina halalkaliphila]|uniref:Acyl-peptide hydrolase n=1 Tax=Aliidiomarina halalkaliphila TaxID=2593535 RepID=A0A552X5L8_9GAMM|nr:S9 family peptidase [Aliidiomarina halalkaliphila]TRW49883.1 S9 family peptidase [Aliidiomarina halalkaliphila]